MLRLSRDSLFSNSPKILCKLKAQFFVVVYAATQRIDMDTYPSLHSTIMDSHLNEHFFVHIVLNNFVCKEVQRWHSNNGNCNKGMIEEHFQSFHGNDF